LECGALTPLLFLFGKTKAASKRRLQITPVRLDAAFVLFGKNKSGVKAPHSKLRRYDLTPLLFFVR
jgi:hypothetical protein